MLKNEHEKVSSYLEEVVNYLDKFRNEIPVVL